MDEVVGEKAGVLTAPEYRLRVEASEGGWYVPFLFNAPVLKYFDFKSMNFAREFLRHPSRVWIRYIKTNCIPKLGFCYSADRTSKPERC
ncbi:unnamed protein product [Caretta caretta]